MLVKATSASFSNHPVLRSALLEAFPGAVFNDAGKRFTKSELIDFIGDADGLILGLDPFDAEVLAACRNLKIVSKYGVGLDNVDLEACRAHNVAVGWTGGVNRRSVAEMVLGFMLSMTRNLYSTSLDLKSGLWNKDGGFQLSGKTVGIIGIGFTGTEVARLLQPFGCVLLGNDIINKDGVCRELGITVASKNEIFERADVVSIHTPLTDLTRGLINRDTLSRMKRTAFVINTARGPIVDLADLKWALSECVIAGAAIDVYEVEPSTDNELLGLRNLFCTPHIGGNAEEAILAMGMSAITHIRELFGR